MQKMVLHSKIDFKIDEKPKIIMCRASDNDGNIQPENINDIWNLRGLSNNSVHKKEIE